MKEFNFAWVCFNLWAICRYMLSLAENVQWRHRTAPWWLLFEGTGLYCIRVVRHSAVHRHKGLFHHQLLRLSSSMPSPNTHLIPWFYPRNAPLIIVCLPDILCVSPYVVNFEQGFWADLKCTAQESRAYSGCYLFYPQLVLIFLNEWFIPADHHHVQAPWWSAAWLISVACLWVQPFQIVELTLSYHDD